MSAELSVVEAVSETIATAAPTIREGLASRRSETDHQNPSDENQLAADVWADELLQTKLLDLDAVGSYASEEREGIATDGDGYSVTIDPLDGSSNLNSNNTMGTIFGVYDAELPAPATDLLGAGFVLYGPLTSMVTLVDGTVSEYVIEDGTRVLVEETVTLPDEPTVFGFGGRVPDWPPTFLGYAREIERELKLRYGGSFIGDVNQILTYGGVFAYPELQSAPEGKLRLQFEGIPIGSIVSAAGGRASTGDGSLLTQTPSTLHERSPIYLGTPELIKRREQRY